MALYKTKGRVPDGAVRLSEEEAKNQQWKLIMNWTPEKDVWPFRYGIGLLAVGTALSSIYINSHYRSKLHLYDYGRFSTYLPIVVLPSLLTVLYHQQSVSSDIIIEKTVCPVCVGTRAASIQALFSTVFPSILAPLSGFMFATRHFTYNLPPITKPMEQFKLWQKLTRPIGNNLFLICVCQAFLAMGITYYEQDSYMNIRQKLLEEALLES